MKKLIPSYVRVPLIFVIVLGAMEYFIDSGEQPAFIKFPMVGLFLVVFLFLLIAIEIVVSAVDNVTYHLLTVEVNSIKVFPKNSRVLKELRRNMMFYSIMITTVSKS
jgi:hypothetical protein